MNTSAADLELLRCALVFLVALGGSGALTATWVCALLF